MVRALITVEKKQSESTNQIPIQSSAALAQVTLLGLIPSPNAQTKRKIRLTKGIAINRIAKNHSTVETV
ncbi:hypothetical protein [Alistipes indistinctus]|uniref:hypothetical protein n=1 Tax=Alistipes indistinctus TaxID=626932 RepID=UPI00266F58CD|nr:hypothetical protein [Alistipes indistinctus]